MIKEIKIETMEDVYEHFMNEGPYDSKIDRYRGVSLYRGMPKAEYKLETSLFRNCKEKQSELEESIVRNFLKYTAKIPFNSDENIWRQLAIGQHYGLPTRLMDWTYSPLIGLHFATSEIDISGLGKFDAAVWEINVDEFNKTLPNKYQKVLEDHSAYMFTVDLLSSVVDSLNEYDDDLKQNGIVLIEPPSIDDRIVNQYSYFSITPHGITNIEEYLTRNTQLTKKYVIDKELIWRIRDLLDRLNISERLVYPGLEGILKWIKRYYYVK